MGFSESESESESDVETGDKKKDSVSSDVSRSILYIIYAGNYLKFQFIRRLSVRILSCWREIVNNYIVMGKRLSLFNYYKAYALYQT